MHCWWGCKLVQLYGMETMWRFLKKKKKKELSYDPIIPFLGIYLKKVKTKRHMYHHVHCRLSYKSQDMKATQMSIYQRMDKENVTHTHNGISFSHKKERILGISSNRDGP